MPQRKQFTPAEREPEPPPIRDGRLPDNPNIDWKGYFIEFCKVHGEPELLGGRLVFRDGWTYPLDYKGPEIPPSGNPLELDQLVVSYWTSRRSRCDRLLSKAIAVRDRIAVEQKRRTLPLQQQIVTKSEEQGQTVHRKGYIPLTTAPLDNKIRWLQQDIEEAEEALRQIEQYYVKQRIA